MENLLLLIATREIKDPRTQHAQKIASIANGHPTLKFLAMREVAKAANAAVVEARLDGYSEGLNDGRPWYTDNKIVPVIRPADQKQPRALGDDSHEENLATECLREFMKLVETLRAEGLLSKETLRKAAKTSFAAQTQT